MLRHTIIKEPCKLVRRSLCCSLSRCETYLCLRQKMYSCILLKSTSCRTLPTCLWSQSRLKSSLHQYHLHQFSTSTSLFAYDPKKPDVLDSLNKSIVKKLQHMEDSLRYHGYSTIRIGLFIVLVVGMSMYIFRESIRENVADEVSHVASRSLEDQMVVVKAEQFAKGLLDAVLNDEQMSRLAAEFVVGVLQRDETKQATARVLRSVIDDPQTRQHLILATKQVFLAALYDESTQRALKVVFKKILADPETRQAAKDLLGYVFAEDDIKNLVADFFKDVIKMEVVIKQATELGKDVTHNVITDPVIQQETGDTMWKAFTHSLTPRWFGGGSTPPAKETTSTPPAPATETSSPETGETIALTAATAAALPGEQGVENVTDIVIRGVAEQVAIKDEVDVVEDTIKEVLESEHKKSEELSLIEES